MQNPGSSGLEWGRYLTAALGLIIVIQTTVPSRAQTALPETGLRYDIEVTVDMKDRTFSGRERIVWRNPSANAVDAVPLHLYLNAFANMSSTWLTERRGGQALRSVENRLRKNSWGFNEPRTIRQAVAGTDAPPEPVEATWTAIQPDDGNVHDRSLILVRLPEPVAPGAELTLDIAFEGRMPKPMARTGCIPGMCFFGQWFPKLAAFETKGTRGAKADGFAARQFHAGTEFYADFADYHVTIRAPEGLTIGATGRAAGRKIEGGQQVVVYEQRAVHDFAFVVGTLDEYTSTFTPEGAGSDVNIRYLAFKGRGFDPERAKRAVHGAMQLLNRRVGPYPYETLTVVYPPANGLAIGGMEYPTLFTGVATDPILFRWPLGGMRLFELVDVHEFGHQYFQHLLATNEQLDAFLDEGFNSYWENEILIDLFGQAASAGHILGRPFDAVLSERSGSGFGRLQEAIVKSPSSLFYPGTGGIQIYSRPAVTLRTAAALFGRGRLDAVFQVYFQRWKFKHPATEDFLGVVQEVGGADMAAFLREGFYKPRHPDFQVDDVQTRKFAEPPGRYVGPDGKPVTITKANRKSHKGLVLDGRAREPDGKVWAQITDPGWADEDQDREGRVFWRGFAPEAGSVAARKLDDDFYETVVRITGPAWTHLPIDVLFRFEDGVSVRERWSGRAAWRSYRFLRGARLEAVVLDPDRKIALDSDIKNNSWLRKPDQSLKADWTAWTGAAFQTLLNAIWGMM